MAERKMIRFDEEEIKEIVAQDAALPDVQQVKPHTCEEYLVVEHCGVSYQKCGGGRRRLAKRSN